MEYTKKYDSIKLKDFIEGELNIRGDAYVYTSYYICDKKKNLIASLSYYQLERFLKEHPVYTHVYFNGEYTRMLFGPWRPYGDEWLLVMNDYEYDLVGGYNI